MLAKADRQALHDPSRLNALRSALPSYLAAISRTECTRSQFEVHRANTRWYIESLLSQPMPNEQQKTLLKAQVSQLCNWAVEHLQALFPSLDPDAANQAKLEAIKRLQSYVDAPLLPIYRRPFTPGQMHSIKANWASAYLRWMAIWDGLQQNALGSKDANNTSITHAFVTASLAELPQAIWPILSDRPAYVQHAYAILAKEQSEIIRAHIQARQAQRTRRSNSDSRLQQVEQWGFALAGLLVTGMPSSGHQTGAKGGER